jgi:flagellar hook-length control protein FliK
MATDRINAAQVMMSVMAKEKGKISRKVEDAGFSSELEAQQRELSAVDSEQTGISPEASSNFLAPSQATENTASEASNCKNDPRPQAEPSEESQSEVTQAKLKKQTFLTNPALLERIMGQLRITAEARQACEASRDEQGRVSIESLLSILNQSGASQEVLVAEAETPTQDVQELLSSLQMAQGQMTPNLDLQALEVKSAGTYNLNEFTALLNNVVGQISNKTGKSFVSAQGGSSSMTGSAGELSMTSGLTDDPQRILASFLPFSSDSNAPGATSSKTLSASLSSSSPAGKAQSEDESALPQAIDTMDASQYLADAGAMDISSFKDLQSIDAQAPRESAFDSDKLFSSQNESVTETDSENTDTPETTAATATLASQDNSVENTLFSNSTAGTISGIGPDEPALTAPGNTEVSGGIAEGDAEAIARASGLDAGAEDSIGSTEAGEPDLKVTTAHGARDDSLADNGSQGKDETSQDRGDAETIIRASGLDSGAEDPAGPAEAGEPDLKVTTAQGKDETSQDRGDAETIIRASGLDSGAEDPAGPAEAGEPDLKVTTAQGARDDSPADSRSQGKDETLQEDESANVKSTQNGASKYIAAFYHSIANNLQHTANGSVNPGTGAAGRLSLSNPAWTQDLSQQIQDLQQQGRSEMVLELEPQNLGRLTLKIEAVNDQITASVSTENEQVKEVLLRNSSALRQQLQQDGLSLGQLQVDVRQGKNGGENFGKNEAQQPRGKGPIRFGDIEEKTPSAPNGVYRNRAESRLISLFA